MSGQPMDGEVTSIFHFAFPAAWARAQSADQYEPDDYASEGYIHAATAAQIPGVTERHLRGKGPRWQLTLDCAAIAGILHWEWNDVGGELFPHLYGPIPMTAITAVAAFDPEL